ncbi:hypothetical protein D3C73_1269830 [compost metagenome]
MRQVERGFDFNPQVGELSAHGRLEQLGRVQQCLGGHATDVQAGAAEGGAPLDASGLEAQLAGADRCVITTGACAQNHDVIVAHGCTPG